MITSPSASLGLVHHVRGHQDRHAVAAKPIHQVPDQVPGARRHTRARLVEEDEFRRPTIGQASVAPPLRAESRRRWAARRRSGRACSLAIAGRAGLRGTPRRDRASRGGGAGRRHRPAARRRCGSCAVLGDRVQPEDPIFPASGPPKPSQISTVVVLPAPLGRSSASTFADRTSTSRSDTAAVLPY